MKNSHSYFVALSVPQVQTPNTGTLWVWVVGYATKREAGSTNQVTS